MKQRLVDLIVASAAELAEEQGVTINGEMTEETLLFGDGGLLDSMGLVSLVVAVEQAVEDELDQSVALADEKALSQSRSPYRTVGSLADYALHQIGE